MGLIELAKASRQEELLAAVAEPTMRRMVRDFCPTAHLGVLDSDFMVTYLAKSTQKSHRVPTRTGSKLEAYCSGLGKVLLAAMSSAERSSYLPEGPFIRLTKKTIIEPQALEAELQLVSHRGFAVDNCELFDDLRCVAVPVFDQANRVVAALSASFPTSQLPTGKVREVVVDMQANARAIGAKLYPDFAGTSMSPNRAGECPALCA
jgi:DNA-binding IclR family transcriptional regulator